MTRAVDLGEVQSLALAPAGADVTRLHLLRFATRQQAVDFAARAAASVTTARDVHERAPGSTRAACNVGLSAAGLRRIGISDRAHDALGPTFTHGMRAAAGRLDDVRNSDPEHWIAPFGPEDRAVHAVVLEHLDTGQEHDDDPAGALRPYLDHPGSTLVAGAVVWEGRRRAEGKEPFGFRDEITAPVVAGAGREVTPGNGVWDDEHQVWRPVATGELLLGHHDESGAVAGHPDAAHLERDGTYLVVRRLQQHVGAFRDACEDWAAELHAQGLIAEPDAELVAALLVGRHRDGRVVGGDGHDPDENDFRYRDDDPAAVPVPPSAHIRRANPRDALAHAGAIVPRHVLFRRGLPYGEPGGEDEGLLFMACCADLRRQFEFVQAEWMQDGNRFGLGGERDPLVGTRTDPDADPDADDASPVPADADMVSVPASGRQRRRMGSFVSTRGGEYFLVPSPSALRLLGDERGE